MKNPVLARILVLAGVVLATGCAATTTDESSGSSSSDIVAGTTSAYTDIGHAKPLDACKLTPATPTHGGFSECGEMGGYTFLELSDSSLAVRSATGTFYLDLGYDEDNLPVGAYPGKLAEWRGRGLSAGRVDPTALIVRYFTPTPVDAPFSGSNFLVVAKLTPDAVCVYDTVSGATPNHNQIARDMADSQAFADYVCPSRTPTPIPPAPGSCGTLPSGTGLELGASISSCSGSHTLVMQEDGNLVIYNNAKQRATWSSQTVDTLVASAFVRPNGQLIVYGYAWDERFSTPTAGNDGASLVLQDDGNLVIYAKDGRALWSTQTQGK